MLASALVVYAYFVKMIHQNAQQQLQLHVYNILSVADFKGTDIFLPSILYNPRFNTAQSGLWAYVLDSHENVAWQSLSATPWNDKYPLPNQSGEWIYNKVASNQHEYLTVSYKVTWQGESNTADYFLIIGEDTQAHRWAIRKLTLWLSLVFATITGLILIGQYLALKRALKPIDTLAEEISAMEQGKREKLSFFYPTELRMVERNINALIEKEHRLRQRYREAMANLAHSLKTPMTILTGELRNAPNNDVVHSALQRINSNIEYQLRRAIVSGHTVFTQSIEIENVIDHVLQALNKIYGHKKIDVTSEVSPSDVFFGDENDMLEILGNILDNAFKHAKRRIAITTQSTDFMLSIRVEDDGPGLERSDAHRVFNRGERLDQTEPGQGIGLAAVADIVVSYGGDINVYHSSLGGACFEVTFNNKENNNG
ncbi:ATP-binding protein [Halioxenophilus aromaticivorans]|uniref:histidine kinase n=2 Tax=Halioxenophilus aromaticivorans TaxID=1306992 RepID=A0AAV3U4S0_9ALTE